MPKICISKFLVLNEAKDLGTYMSWYVYIIECKDGKLYTGITNNLERRIRDHNSGSASRFTKYRAPVELLYSEDCLTRQEALRREAQIKKLPRPKKLALIATKQQI